MLSTATVPKIIVERRECETATMPVISMMLNPRLEIRRTSTPNFSSGRITKIEMKRNTSRTVRLQSLAQKRSIWPVGDRMRPPRRAGASAAAAPLRGHADPHRAPRRNEHRAAVRRHHHVARQGDRNAAAYLVGRRIDGGQRATGLARYPYRVAVAADRHTRRLHGHGDRGDDALGGEVDDRHARSGEIGGIRARPVR